MRFLRSAATELMHVGRICSRSAVYETDPVGGPPQPRYLNAALWLVTELLPDALWQCYSGLNIMPADTATANAINRGRSIWTCFCSVAR